MSAITLTERQAAHLSQHGWVVVIEPAALPVVERAKLEGSRVTYLGEGGFYTGYVDCPHQPGDVVEVRFEVIGYGGYDVPIADRATVTSVRAMRLQEVGVRNMHAAGVPVEPKNWGGPYSTFPRAWNKLNPAHPWDSNPVVWVIELEKANA